LKYVDGAGDAAGDEYSRVPDIPVALLVAQASRLHVQPGRLHHKACRIDFTLRRTRLACGTANSKFETYVSGWFRFD
jgi:hypothetical protein